MDLEKVGLISHAGTHVPLQRADVRLAVQDIICETSVTQEYANEGKKPIEAVYTFPLPSDAVLLAFELNLGGKAYHGQVVERKEAEKGYEAAIETGDAAFRLQRLGEGLYTMSVGNLKPSETASIHFRYAQLLRWSGNRLSVRVPTTIAPRYGEAAEIEPWQRPEVSLLVDHPFTLSLCVSGALTKARFECPTHPVSIDVRENQVQIALTKGALLDRDFVLIVESDAPLPMALVARHGAGSVALASLTPAAPDVQEPGPRSVVIAVDCSGSMAGDSMAQAKEALRQILMRLRPEDCFELLAFGSYTTPWASRCVPVSRKNLRHARAFIEKLDANMNGTEIAVALRAAVETKAPVEPCDIMVITDGDAWLDDEFFTLMQKGNRRIFAVGVGAAPAEGNLKRLAEVTSGAFEQVTPNEDMSARIERHFVRLFQPLVTSAKLEWPTEPAWMADGQRGAIFAGDTAAFFAGFTLPVEGAVRVRLGFQGAEPMAAYVTLEPTDTSALSEDTLVRLAAAARMGACTNTREALLLALEHQLVTPNTDYLVVIERAESERTNEMPVLQVVPQMLAAGWGGVGSVGSHVAMRQATGTHGPVSATQCNYEEMEAPAAIRRNGQQTVQALRESGSEMLDIPAFLRKQPGYDVPLKTYNYSVGVSHVPDNATRTPRSALKLLAARCLQTLKPDFLPTKFARLEELGLPDFLFDAIDDALEAMQAEGYDEHLFVLALLAVLRERLPAIIPKRLAPLIDKVLLDCPVPSKLYIFIEGLVPNLSADSWGGASATPRLNEWAMANPSPEPRANDGGVDKPVPKATLTQKMMRFFHKRVA